MVDQLPSLDKCVLCGSCLSVCPIFKTNPLESLSPRGKLYFLQMKNHLNLDQELEKAHAQTVFACTVCGLCDKICDSDVSLLDIYYNVKGKYARKGYVPELNKFRKTTKAYGNLFGLDNSMKTEFWIDYAEDEVSPNIRECILTDGKSAEICLFLGCLTSLRAVHQQTLLDILKVFERFNVDYLLLGDEHCCGHPYTLIGLDEEAESLRRHNSELFKKGRFKIIVTNCPGCLLALKNHHQIPKGVRVLHLTEFLNERINDRDITNPITETITYHKPCELHIIGKIDEAPIILLKKIGLEINELENWCCGGGGMLRLTDKNLSQNVLKKKLTEQELDTKADLYTCCPGCVQQFTNEGVNASDIIKYVELATRIKGGK